MRRRIDTCGIEFRVGGAPLKRQVSRQNPAQRTASDGRPIWVVKLNAYDPGAGKNGSTESIWVEVAGDEPVLAVNEVAAVTELVHAPWINSKGEMVESFRARSIVVADGAKSRAA